MSGLTHFDKDGRAHMVNVGEKAEHKADSDCMWLCINVGRYHHHHHQQIPV